MESYLVLVRLALAPTFIPYYIIQPTPSSSSHPHPPDDFHLLPRQQHPTISHPPISQRIHGLLNALLRQRKRHGNRLDPME